MGVMYAYASIAENGTVNGKAGDQTKTEVKKRAEYNFGQTRVIHFTDKKVRAGIGNSAMEIADNNAIGYSQATRNGLFNQMFSFKWDIDKIKKVKSCNTDCSSMSAVCINCGFGKKVLPSDTTSRNIVTYVQKFCKGKCKVLPYEKGMTLYKGDIIQKNGHVVVVYKGGKAGV